MPQIYVCPLSQITATVRSTGARTMVTLINKDTPVLRPQEIEQRRHLFVPISDITIAAEGHILPAAIHVEQMLEFVRNRWDRQAPLIIHCYAGVSRSTAAAYIAACALNETRGEDEIAAELRRRSPTATPNRLLIEVADAILGRKGRMIDAVARIGRGTDCFEGVPFALDLIEDRHGC